MVSGDAKPGIAIDPSKPFEVKMPVLAITAIFFGLCIWANDAWSVFPGLPTPVLIVAFVFWLCMSAFFLWLSSPTKAQYSENAQSDGGGGGYFADSDGGGGDGGD